MIKSLWSTAEAESWARDLGYEGYVEMCTILGVKSIGLNAYRLLCQAFEAQYEEEMMLAQAEIRLE